MPKRPATSSQIDGWILENMKNARNAIVADHIISQFEAATILTDRERMDWEDVPNMQRIWLKLRGKPAPYKPIEWKTGGSDTVTFKRPKSYEAH